MTVQMANWSTASNCICSVVEKYHSIMAIGGKSLGGLNVLNNYTTSQKEDTHDLSVLLWATRYDTYNAMDTWSGWSVYSTVNQCPYWVRQFRHFPLSPAIQSAENVRAVRYLGTATIE